MQDFTGVPAVVDLAAMRDATTHLGADPRRINPQVPVDLVIDHSVMVDFFGTQNAFGKNVEMEYERNGERYTFLRWGQEAFENFRVVPPGTGICHQVNLEYLAQTVWTREERENGARVTYAFPDTLVGTDSHTTMVNGLSVLGWGVGGIEAEAAMLGQPISMLIPEVVGFRMTGKLPEGTTATDLVLTVTQMLRKKGVVGKFVEFFGPGLSNLTVEDRATIGNMAPEYGATCGLFPIEDDTLTYLTATGRDAGSRGAGREPTPRRRACGARTTAPIRSSPTRWSSTSAASCRRSPVRSGRRTAWRSPMRRFRFANAIAEIRGIPAGTPAAAMVNEGGGSLPETLNGAAVAGADYRLADGHVVIAAITSCTNTSNPSVLIGAGLLAKKANELGLKPKPWVKTSLAPGSQVVTEYLEKAGLQQHLDALGFNLVGYGCTTCIGNSGPLPEAISEAINKNDLVACSVLSGNRNFEGRVNPDVRANYLASPPLVVAYALAGSLKVDITREPLGTGKDGKPVYLKDLWPTSAEISALIRKVISEEMFRARYGDVFKGDEHWRNIQVEGGLTYRLVGFLDLCAEPALLHRHEADAGAADRYRGRAHPRPLPRIRSPPTTSRRPAPSSATARPANTSISHQVRPVDFNSYGARRGNHEVMMRGTFANIRIKNQMVPGVEGGVTHPLSLRRADVDLRRGDALRGGEGAARHLRRQGIRHRLVARLGGEGHAAARRARGDRAVLRAHPSLEPRRHGRAAAGARGRHELAEPRPEGRREGHASAASPT